MPMPQKIKIPSVVDPVISIATFSLAILPAAVSHLRADSDQAQHKGPK